MGFDVVRQPWIPTVGLDGQTQMLGIGELLLHAHELKEIRDVSPLQEYGMYRLLTVFVMDMLRLRGTEDIEDALDEGSFSKSTVDGYIDACESSGPCFDLFDPERPFLQDSFCDQWDGDHTIRPVALLLHEVPTGQNHMHYLHQTADQTTMDYPACARALTAVSTFCTSGLQGPSSINGAPPVYVLINGNNLYETLLFNCIGSATCVAPSCSDPPPAWRDNRQIGPKTKLAAVSLLEGMTLRARRALLIDDARTQTVSRMHFQAGLDFVGYDSWRDPHTVNTKKGASLKPSLDKDLWRDLAIIFGSNETCPLTVNQYRDIKPYERIDITAYALLTRQAAYLAWKRDRLSVPGEILHEQWRLDLLDFAIQRAELMGKEMTQALKSIDFDSKQKDSQKRILIRRAADAFYSAVRERLLTELIPQMCQQESDQQEALARTWAETIRHQTLTCFDTVCPLFGDYAMTLEKQAVARRNLRMKLEKLRIKEDV